VTNGQRSAQRLDEIIQAAVAQGQAPTVAAMTRDQLTELQRARVWPGFSFLGDRGWGYGVSVLADGGYTWEGGLGTTWVNVPD
jgi:hypothetical protein